MLEDLAFSLLSQPEAVSLSVGYGLLVLGAIIAAVTSRSRSELRRAPYFSYTSILLLASTAVQYLSVYTIDAMAAGVLWLLVLIYLVAAISIGYLFGLISMARSRDAFGHGWWAVLAFVPLANLILLLKASKQEFSGSKIATIPLVTGRAGVLSGFFVFGIALALSWYLDVAMSRMTWDYSNPAEHAAAITYMIRSQGLEETLQEMTLEVQVPVQLSELITLHEVEIGPGTIRYILRMAREVFPISDGFRQEVVQSICSDIPLRPILEAGGAVEYTYLSRDLQEIGHFRVTVADCGV